MEDHPRIECAGAIVSSPEERRRSIENGSNLGSRPSEWEISRQITTSRPRNMFFFFACGERAIDGQAPGRGYLLTLGA